MSLQWHHADTTDTRSIRRRVVEGAACGIGLGLSLGLLYVIGNLT